MTKQQKRKKYLRHQQFKSAAVAAATVATIAFNHRSVQAAEEIQPTAVPEPEVRATSEAESPLESAETLEFIEESQPMAVSAPVADTNSEAEIVETPVTTRTVPLTYTVRYVDRYTKEVVHSVIKTVTIETSDAVAKTVVTENGAELVNDSQLEWYYVPDGNPTNLSLTVIEGEENVLTYEVEGFGEKEVKERAVDISYRVDYIDSATQNVIYSETKTHTVQTKLSQASTTVTVVADALNTASQLETYSLPTNTANNKTVTITEGMENIFTFELESADTSKGRTTRKVDYSAGENAPYLTIENYTENAKGNDTQIYKTNGETVHLNYKIGYTRIAAEDLDLTEDAKKLGLTLNTDTGFISGDVLLDTSRLGAYKIGIQSKNAPKVTVAATLVVQSHIGFVLEDDDNVRGYSSEFVKPNPVMNFRKVNYAPGDVYGLPYNSVEELNVPLSELIYSMNLTTTPFGYYVDSKQTVAEATPTTEQYNVILPLVARYDNAREFQNNGMALTITEFTQLEASEGVAVELMDLRTADLTGLVTTPSSTYATLTDYGRYTDVTNTTPYFVRFTSLPKTEGSYNVKFKIVDNLGLEKFMTINFKTVERSMSGAITHADVRFTGTKDFINPVTNTVQVPATTAEQVLGTVHLNKENAWIKEVKLPEGAKLVSTKLNDEGKPTEVQVVKEEGTKLKPGSYTIEVRAIDGHFADDAPNRLFTFLVTDAIKPIEHQVWREGTMPDPIHVSMESGSLISDIRIVNSGNNAYLEANVTDSNISIYGLEETTETQKARVYVTYLNEDGTSTETFTDFTYVVLAEPDNDLRVSVTNAAQEVVEGTRWKDMVISHTEGANLLVDTSSLPKGTKYDEVTKTISGIGRYEGTYDISVVVEKDGVVKGTVVHLVVTPGVFEVPDETIEVTVLGKYDNLGLNELPDGARVIYDVSLDSQSAGFKTNESGTRITGNPTYVGTHTVNATVFKTASNGIVRSDTATLTIKVKGIPASLDISNDDQSIDVGTAIQDIQITKDPHSTLSVSTSSLPPGVTYNKETGIISGTPTQYGDYYISVSTEMPSNYAGDLNYNQRYIYKQIRLNVRKHTPTLTVSSEEQTFSAATDMTPVVLTNDERSRLEVTNLPDGVRYDPATKTISGRPSNGIGDYWINVSASMPSELGGDVIYKNIRLTVTPIASSLDATNDKQTVVAKQGIEAIQVIKDDYSIMSEPYVLIGYTQYSLSDVGLQYNSDTKTITGNPTIVGAYTIKLRTVLESKLGGGEANKDITLTVNQIPFTIDITNQEQTKVVLTEIAPVTVTVPDDTTISVNELQLPPGIRYNANTKTFEGTPTRVGDYTVDVSARPTGVTNNTLTKTVTFRITALPATIHISNSNQTVQVGTAITPSVVTPNQYAEVRGIDSLLSVIGGSDSIGVPEYLIAEYLQSQYGLTYDANTHTISGKPTKSGKILFRFKSWNTYDLGGESAEETYVLNVTDEQSRIPVITSAIEGEKTISGKGVNEALVTVTLPDGSEKTATVTDGVWTVSTEQALVKGQNISARQKEVNKSVSDNISGSVMAAEAPSVSTLAKVNPIIEGSTSVSGTGVDGSTVTIILPDGTKRTAQVTNGTWTVENIPALSKGQSIVVTQAENGKSSSDAIAITVVPQNTKGDNGLGTIIETETTTDPAGSGRDGLLVKIYSINEQGVKSATPTSTAFIPHGQDGLNGTNGVDGKSVTAIAQPDGSVKIVETDPTTGANRDVAVITNGRDGRDGTNGVGTVVVTSAG
ncbi:putative Ig domain-containing protein, partial [Streptococcus suis]|uniref:putative Ig domain-containing protein n=1 Tax=Streptococcus suis TaxID=1307 RepID=UPI002FC8D4B6